MSNNSLLNTGLSQPLFVDGERPSATKFNSLFSYLNFNILLVSSVIGNAKGSSDIRYTEPLYRSLEQSKVDLNIVSISDTIGPLSSLNPRSYENITNPDNFVTEDIAQGISQHMLRYESKAQTSDITISGYVRKNSINDLINDNDYYHDSLTNSILFKVNTANQLSVTYKTKDSFRKFSYLGSGFNVVPHPYQAQSSDNEYKLKITPSNQINKFVIELPKIKRNQSNNIIEPNQSNSLNETNSLFDYQIEIPKFIWDTYNPSNYSDYIPSNVIALKCLDTGEVFDKASYVITNKTTITVSNLSISLECLESMKFVLIFSGASNLTMNIDDLHKKMGRHTHDGTYGEERIDIKNISGIFYTQHNSYKYYPSLNIPLNHMPQYLHRNGWSYNCDPINNDNVINGHLVVIEKLIFGKPTSETIDKPNFYFSDTTLMLNNANKNLLFSNIDIFNLESKNLNLFLENVFNIFSPEINLNTNNLQIGDTSEYLTSLPVKVSYRKSLEETYNATLNVIKYDKVDGNSNLNNPIQLTDGFQKAKEEKVTFTDSGESTTSILRTIYKNNSPKLSPDTANYIIESKNNLNDFVVNGKKRSGKLSAETTKTIILNCIPTRESVQIPSADNPGLLPEYLVAQGELTDNQSLPLTEKEFSDIPESILSSVYLYNLSTMNIQSVLKFNNKLRQRFKGKTIPKESSTENYPLIAKLGNVYFALVKREKFLTDDAATYFNTTDENVHNEKYQYNRNVNETISLLDTTKEGSRDHLENKFYLNPTTKSYFKEGVTPNEYEIRKASEKYDCFYESDLTYMPIKWKAGFEAPPLEGSNQYQTYYNNLTIEDIDSTTELRLIELRELESLNHPYSLGSGNNGFFLPVGSYKWLFEAFPSTDGAPSWLTGALFPMRHTSTTWFRESFPLVRITNSKTNIINIDHAHNVDLLNKAYNVLYPKDINALQYNKTWSLGNLLKGALGHLLFRTQMITAMIDVDHAYLSNDNEYKYEINIDSKIAPLHYSEDDDGIYNKGYSEDAVTVGIREDEVEDIDPDVWHRQRKFANYTGLSKRSYDFFYDQRNQSSSFANFRNYSFQLDEFTIGKNNSSYTDEAMHIAKAIYEGPCIKLIVRDVDHYVVKAIPSKMEHDSAKNLEVLNTTPQTYRLGFKDLTHIKRDSNTLSTKEFNGVFFYNYSSSGFFHERYLPTNTATSNLAVMTNSDEIAALQSTTEGNINITSNQTPLKATRRIPSYACLNNSRDIEQHTSFSWDDIVITNTSNLQIKVTVREELVPIYPSVSSQTNSLGESIYNPGVIGSNGESTTTIYDNYLDDLRSSNINRNPLSANLLHEGYKKVKVAYIETNNQLYYKCNDHRFTALDDDTSNEYIPENVTSSYPRSMVEDRHKTKDLHGQNKFGMRNAYLGPSDRPLEAFKSDWKDWVGRALRRSKV